MKPEILYDRGEDRSRIADIIESISESNSCLPSISFIPNPDKDDRTDFIICGKIGVERKSIDDFINSLKDNKVRNQLQMIADHGYEPILLVEGIYPSKYTQMPLQSVYGYLSSISADGIKIIHTVSREHTARWLLKIAQKLLDGEWGKFKVPVMITKAHHSTIKQLASFDSVGEERAFVIRKHYKSLASFIRSMEAYKRTGHSRLLKVHGFDKKLLDNISNDVLQEWGG